MGGHLVNWTWYYDAAVRIVRHEITSISPRSRRFVPMQRRYLGYTRIFFGTVTLHRHD